MYARSTTFQAMDSNRDAAAAERSASTQQAGIAVVDTGEFELALAHLRVPELI